MRSENSSCKIAQINIECVQPFGFPPFSHQLFFFGVNFFVFFFVITLLYFFLFLHIFIFRIHFFLEFNYVVLFRFFVDQLFLILFDSIFVSSITNLIYTVLAQLFMIEKKLKKT